MNRTRTGSRPTRKVRWAPPDTCPECGLRGTPPWRSTIDGEGSICGSYQCPECREIWYTNWRIDAL